MARRPAAVLLLFPLLGGCPYLWAPPELNAVDSGIPIIDTDADTDVDTDTDTDTDADTDTDTGTGPTTVPPEPPVVDSFDAVFRFDEVELIFTLSDADGDLVGGIVTLIADGPPVDYAIPGDLDSWDGSTGTILLPVAAPCTGVNESYTVVPEDASGLGGIGANATLIVTAHTVTEVGELPDVLGPIALPAIVCGDLSNNNDVDLTSFEPTVGGTFTFTLTYPPGGDRDLELSDALGAPIAAATTANNPDSFVASVTAGLLYHLEVFSVGGGPGGDWTIVIHE